MAKTIIQDPELGELVFDDELTDEQERAKEKELDDRIRAATPSIKIEE